MSRVLVVSQLLMERRPSDKPPNLQVRTLTIASDIYDPERARGRLSVIPDKLLQRSIADLKARGVITTLVKAAGPTIAAARGDASGDYVMDSSFHNMLADAGNLTPGALRAAAQYKLELDEAFRAAGEESVLRLTALTAEQSMCLTYLMTTGAVRALPHFIGSSYQDITVGADGVASGFETRLSPVQDKYKFGLGHVVSFARLTTLWRRALETRIWHVVSQFRTVLIVPTRQTRLRPHRTPPGSSRYGMTSTTI